MRKAIANCDSLKKKTTIYWSESIQTSDPTLLLDLPAFLPVLEAALLRGIRWASLSVNKSPTISYCNKTHNLHSAHRTNLNNTAPFRHWTMLNCHCLQHNTAHSNIGQCWITIASSIKPPHSDTGQCWIANASNIIPPHSNIGQCSLPLPPVADPKVHAQARGSFLISYMVTWRSWRFFLELSEAKRGYRIGLLFTEKWSVEFF